MTAAAIIKNRDLSLFLKLKRKDLIAFLHSYGITEKPLTGKLVKNMDQYDLRQLACAVIKLQRQMQQ